MSTPRLAYDDAVTLSELAGDAHAVGRRLPLPSQRGADETDAPYAERGTPHISDSLASRAAELETPYA